MPAIGENDKRQEARRQEDKELRLLLSTKLSYFVSTEKLGLIEANVRKMNSLSTKRSRAVELNAIQFVLKKLGVIPHSVKVVALAHGCLDAGDSGLLILCESPTKILGQLPEVIK